MIVKQEDEYIYIKFQNGTTLAVKEEAEGVVLDFWENLKEAVEPIQSTYYFYHEIGNGFPPPVIPDSACSFGKCDGQNVCQKLGKCRYKHHTEGGYKNNKK